MLRLENGMFSDQRAQFPSESKCRISQMENPVAESEGLSLRFEVGGDIAISYPNVRETKHSGSPRTEGLPGNGSSSFNTVTVLRKRRGIGPTIY